ncbi:MAG TPA: cupin domain-containing protein [Burkholderiales bacterium]|nr:cupin domain-containing protein [Burkholderiales bacterium]
MREFEHNHLADTAAPRRWALARTAALLPPVGTTPRSAAVYEHGSLLLKLFAPHRTDPQQPHTRDEIYVVAQGKGWFVNGDVRHPFGPGDVLFVPAGVVHRFEDFGDDLMLWVVFYGPEGGEKPSEGVNE